MKRRIDGMVEDGVEDGVESGPEGQVENGRRAAAPKEISFKEASFKEDGRLAGLRLLHLTSPSLPLGGFAYSQGLEWAVEQGWVKDETDLQDWLSGLMRYSMAQLDVPVLARCYRAWPGDLMSLARWDRFLIASRETAELRREETDRGRMLMRCLEGMAGGEEPAYRPVSFVCAYSFAARRLRIALGDAAQGYLWSWLENQAAAAIRLIPLGQTAGQRALFRLAEEIPAAVDAGLSLPDDELGASAPALALASALHETQYTRLFRS